jgi:hypothetical protein
MEKLLIKNQTYSYYEYATEKEFEQVIVENAEHIFGSRSIYVDIKKRIGNDIITIPDGYLIDFSFAEPKLYIIENELSSHDPYKHIGSQILKFAISYKQSGRKIKAFLYDYLKENNLLQKVECFIDQSRFRNIDNLLESIVFERPIAAIVIIDSSSWELENVLSQLTIDTDILEFQTFTYGTERVHKFTPFNAEVRDVTEKNGVSMQPDELNTVVVAARKEGFEEEFLENNRWYAIRIHASMIDKIKYIAAYQVAPVSAITHYAEVTSIEKWGDTNKYVLYFNGAAKSIEPITLDKDKKGLAPQAPRYTSFEKLKNSTKMSEVF